MEIVPLQSTAHSHNHYECFIMMGRAKPDNSNIDDYNVKLVIIKTD